MDFDYVITVCDNANQRPVFPGKVDRIHWSIDDPVVSGDREPQLKPSPRCDELPGDSDIHRRILSAKRRRRNSDAAFLILTRPSVMVAEAVLRGGLLWPG